jgi:hypothetical protein
VPVHLAITMTQGRVSFDNPTNSHVRAVGRNSEAYSANLSQPRGCVLRRYGLRRPARNDEIGSSGATKQPDRQITKSLSIPTRKNISLHPDGQINGITPRVSPERGAGRDRHERAVGCGGRGSCARRTQLTRTAKSCGSGAPMLAPSFAEMICEVTVARKPVAGESAL